MNSNVVKYIFTTVFFFAIAFPARAQFFERNFIYVSGLPCFGTHLGAEVNLNYIRNNRFSVKGGYSNISTKARSYPDDYKGGAGFIPDLIPGPDDQFETGQLLLGWVVDVKSNFRVSLISWRA